MKTMQLFKRYALVATLALVFSTSFAQDKMTAIGISKVWGTVEGVAVEGLVQGPSAAKSELQVACVFEYTEGDIFNAPPALPAPLNGLIHLDDALNHQLTELRKSGKFHGHALETVLLTPAKSDLAAPKLLIIGLGDRNKFDAEIMKQVGSVAVREALRLGVSHFAFASDLKDAGIDSPTAKVAGYVTEGIFDAYRSELWFKDQKLTTFKPLKKVTLLAGPAFFEVAGQGINEALSNLKK
jgi:hypothetical protein